MLQFLFSRVLEFVPLIEKDISHKSKLKKNKKMNENKHIQNNQIIYCVSLDKKTTQNAFSLRETRNIRKIQDPKTELQNMFEPTLHKKTPELEGKQRFCSQAEPTQHTQPNLQALNKTKETKQTKQKK